MTMNKTSPDLFDLAERVDRLETELGLDPVQLRETDIKHIFSQLDKDVELSEIKQQYIEMYGDRADRIDWTPFEGKQLPKNVREALLGGFMPLSDLEAADGETLSELKIEADLSEYNLEFLELVDVGFSSESRS